MTARLLLNLTLAFAVVFAGLFFPFGYIKLGLASEAETGLFSGFGYSNLGLGSQAEAWYAPWPLTLAIGIGAAAVGIGLRKTDRNAGTVLLGFMALGYFVGCVSWIDRLSTNEQWMSLGAASFTFPAVALIGIVIVPIVRLVNELHNN